MSIIQLWTFLSKSNQSVLFYYQVSNFLIPLSCWNIVSSVTDSIEIFSSVTDSIEIVSSVKESIEIGSSKPACPPHAFQWRPRTGGCSCHWLPAAGGSREPLPGGRRPGRPAWAGWGFGGQRRPGEAEWGQTLWTGYSATSCSYLHAYWLCEKIGKTSPQKKVTIYYDYPF